MSLLSLSDFRKSDRVDRLDVLVRFHVWSNPIDAGKLAYVQKAFKNFIYSNMPKQIVNLEIALPATDELPAQTTVVKAIYMGSDFTSNFNPVDAHLTCSTAPMRHYFVYHSEHELSRLGYSNIEDALSIRYTLEDIYKKDNVYQVNSNEPPCVMWNNTLMQMFQNNLNRFKELETQESNFINPKQIIDLTSAYWEHGGFKTINEWYPILFLEAMRVKHYANISIMNPVVEACFNARCLYLGHIKDFTDNGLPRLRMLWGYVGPRSDTDSTLVLHLISSYLFAGSFIKHVSTPSKGVLIGEQVSIQACKDEVPPASYQNFDKIIKSINYA